MDEISQNPRIKVETKKFDDGDIWNEIILDPEEYFGTGKGFINLVESDRHPDGLLLDTIHRHNPLKEGEMVI